MTHTQVSARHGGDGGLTTAERRLLRRRRQPQNQHIMGWGADNPEPSPGQFDWTSLDRRIDMIREAGGVPIITLCCAPDWMKGGEPGETDWSLLERAPDEEHYRDFADLAAQVARRYPDVTYFQVWNELKGFYDRSRNRWDIEAYTRMYNLVYDAVKAVRPDARVGGPYATVESWSSTGAASHPSSLRGPWGVIDQRALDAIAYWLEHNTGADFITMSVTTATGDAGLTTDPFTALGKLTTLTRWVRSRTALPIWIAEWYPLPERGSVGLRHQDAIISAGLVAMIEADVSTVLLWRPRGGDRASCRGCLWTMDGGEPTPTPLHASIAQLAAVSEVSITGVDATGRARFVTSRAGTFAVSTIPRAAVTRHGGGAVRLGPYETKMLDG